VPELISLKRVNDSVLFEYDIGRFQFTIDEFTEDKLKYALDCHKKQADKETARDIKYNEITSNITKY